MCLRNLLTSILLGINLWIFRLVEKNNGVSGAIAILVHLQPWEWGKHGLHFQQKIIQKKKMFMSSTGDTINWLHSPILLMRVSVFWRCLCLQRDQDKSCYAFYAIIFEESNQLYCTWHLKNRSTYILFDEVQTRQSQLADGTPR